jgi:hypothetical protein
VQNTPIFRVGEDSFFEPENSAKTVVFWAVLSTDVTTMFGMGKMGYDINRKGLPLPWKPL